MSPSIRSFAAWSGAVAARHAAALLDWWIPPVCPRCGRRSARPAEQYCRPCWAGLRSLRPADARWFLPSVSPPVPVRSAFAVDGLFLEILSASKYGGARPVGRRLASAAAARLVAGRVIPDPCILVPVPLTAAKRRSRGFNQSEDFAAELATGDGRQILGRVLRRRREGPALAGLPREHRRRAIRGAFVVPEGSRTGAPVILVDDVVTTGSTAGACVEALRAGGIAVAGVLAMGRAFPSSEDGLVLGTDLVTRL